MCDDQINGSYSEVVLCCVVKRGEGRRGDRGPCVNQYGKFSGLCCVVLGGVVLGWVEWCWSGVV